jgi:chromosome segregation ATPase
MAAGKRMVETRRREFAAVSAQIDQRRVLAKPSEQRADEAEQRLMVGKARVRALEERVRAIETEQKSLKSATDPQTLAHIEGLEAQRQATWGDIQSLHVELLPLTEDHARLQADLAQHNAALADLASQQARLVDAAERDQGRHKLATGGAQAAYRAALSSLAQAALRENLGDLAPDAAHKSSAAQAPIPAAREQESLLRAALESYDHTAYNRGVQLLAAACIGTFTLFLLLLAR